MEHAPEKSLTAKRKIVVAFRLTADEATHIDAAGAALRRPRRRADFCRAAALHIARQRVPEPAKPIRLPPRRLPALDTQLLSMTLGQLGKLGSNINQLARAANQRGGVPDAAVYAAIAHDVASIRDAVAAALRGCPGEEAP
jgi:uncharacterized protein (DUF1778 family)